MLDRIMTMRQEILHSSRNNFSIENKLLLYSLRTDCDLDTVKKIEALLGKSIDWTFIIQKAISHGVMPLLYQNLSKICQQSIPKTTFEKLRKFFYVNARHNLILSQGLLRVLSIFQSQGISAAPFKGPSLAAAIYGDISMRQFSDLDIFIKENDVERARAVLLSQGYRPDPVHQLDFEAHYISENNRFNIDLHWAFSFKDKRRKRDVSFAFDLEGIWERMGQIAFLESMIPQFSKEDMFIIRCQDAVKEYWKDPWPKLIWIHDIAQMVKVHAEMDWEWVVWKAKRSKSQRLIFLCLSLVEKLIGTPLPEMVRLRIPPDNQVKVLMKQACRMFFDEGEAQNPFLDKHRGFLRRELFCIRLKESFKDRIPYYLKMLRGYRSNACRAIKNKEDRSLLLLPNYLSFLYYLFFVLYYILRPLWRTARFGSRLLNLGLTQK
jgi:putative nucleotidyltransferase-like protein